MEQLLTVALMNAGIDSGQGARRKVSSGNTKFIVTEDEEDAYTELLDSE